MSVERDARPATGSIRAAQVVLPCGELHATQTFFVEELGFRLERISPADDPRQALVSGHGLRILLERDPAPPIGRIQLQTDEAHAGAREVRAPNGTIVEFVSAEPRVVVPDGGQELVLTRAYGGAGGADGPDGPDGPDGWGTGRAGMGYRDLIPGRYGGRFIASHIRIADAGPVPDQVHFHAIRFQMIYCKTGWVRVVYEDQGPPFVLQAGDAVLQPPRIRHRVLESSAGLEVVELACPAEHDTLLDHEIELPTLRLDVERLFEGQRFVHHRAQDAAWQPWGESGLEARELGIAAATDGLARAEVVRRGKAPGGRADLTHAGELLFLFVLAGSMRLEFAERGEVDLGEADSVTVPSGAPAAIQSVEAGTEFLLVRLPA